MTAVVVPETWKQVILAPSVGSDISQSQGQRLGNAPRSIFLSSRQATRLTLSKGGHFDHRSECRFQGT